MTKHLSLSDFRGSNIEKAYAANDEFNSQFRKDLIEKGGSHKNHKYLRIENGKYIYDHSKMTAQDHRDEQQFHNERAKHHLDNWERSKQTKKDEHELVKHVKHVDMANEHQKLANDKYESETESQKKFKNEYMMLSRLMMDNDYYLGFGNKNASRLWAGSVDDQIAEMKRLYEILPVKPEWISMEDILRYEQKMKNQDNSSEIKKSELFDILSVESNVDVIEKSDNPADASGDSYSKQDHEHADNISKAFDLLEIAEDGSDLIEKGAHANHKYLRIENGKYIYDYDKMGANDHKKAAEEHRYQEKMCTSIRTTSFPNKKPSKELLEEEKMHREEAEKHEKLASEKEKLGKFESEKENDENHSKDQNKKRLQKINHKKEARGIVSDMVHERKGFEYELRNMSDEDISETVSAYGYEGEDKSKIHQAVKEELFNRYGS